jgi:hypothetical protein
MAEKKNKYRGMYLEAALADPRAARPEPAMGVVFAAEPSVRF